MSAKFSFQLQAEGPRARLPHKLLIALEPPETPAHALLKLLGFLLFHRDRLQLETSLHDDNIPFRPDLVQLDYALRPALWIECGECSVDKLDRLAVKVPEAELWVLKRSQGEAEALALAMTRRGLRRGRYQLVGFDAPMFEEMLGLLQPRNQVFWVGGRFDPPQLQLEFNGLWFDHEFTLIRF